MDRYPARQREAPGDVRFSQAALRRHKSFDMPSGREHSACVLADLPPSEPHLRFPPFGLTGMSKALQGQAAVSIYPLGSYTFGNKEPKPEKDATLEQMMQRMRQK